MTPEQFVDQLESAIQDDDLDTLQKLKLEFFDGGDPSFPFEPALRFQSDEGFEGHTGIALANRLSRAIRASKFRRKKRSSYNGPIIVSEGDSWFQYPIVLEDVIDQLSHDYAILSLGAAGDTLSNMISEAEYLDVIQEEKADILLFSASGNDVLGGGHLADLLNNYQSGMEAQDLIRQTDFEQVLTRVITSYTDIISKALSARSNIKILFHGYDRPVPRKGGKWLGGPMETRQFPPYLQSEVTGWLVDRLNIELAGLERHFSGRVRHVDCRGLVGATVNSWYDELHPRNAGYARVASLFKAQIETARASNRFETTALQPSAIVSEEIFTSNDQHWQAVEEAIVDVQQSSDVDRLKSSSDHALDAEMIAISEQLERERQVEDQDKRKRARRRMLPVDDDLAFERILGESNLFPINYLSRGARKARAIAKIQMFYRGGIPAGSGTGFLVAPGLLLTNNHVLETRRVARASKAIFDFQLDDDYNHTPSQTFDITDDIFFTSPRHALDFTFVSVRQTNVDGQDLGVFGQFELIEESGKAVKNEPVSIIQHPKGGLKQIALRDSKILGVKGDFIYYTTDTQRGSSGAALVNDQWLPVAVHHRSVEDPNNPGHYIANRGIRVSSIFNALREASRLGDEEANKILRLLDADEIFQPVSMPLDGRPLRNREIDFIPRAVPSETASGLPTSEEADFPSSRWADVDGYDPNFLSAPMPLPLPQNNEDVNEVNGRPDLPYMHFSVVMSRSRKLPLVTACNVDGTSIRRLKRRGSWRFDPRLPNSEQVGNDAYRNNDLDRGHMVRRVAPMWGSREEARFAEADTFHYTVSVPQHAKLNQRAWLDLEDYLLDWADNSDARLNIYTGVVNRPDDPLYRGIVRIPSDFWKVAIAETLGGFRAVGYLHTQKHLIPSVEEAFGDYQTHRVPIDMIHELTGIDFGPVQAHDVIGGTFEAMDTIRIVAGPEDIGL